MYRPTCRSWCVCWGVAGLLVGLAGFALAEQQGGLESARPPSAAEELVSGPIHEAFAQPVNLNPQPGLVAPKEPPPAITEVPPDHRPEGDNVAFIGGYWSWDPERADYVWVSGIWRAIPPSRQWVAGYWHKVDAGYQWVSGFWAPAGQKQVEYLPAPPPTLENGPSSLAPAADYVWIPGHWRWVGNHFVWQPGFWMAYSDHWVWVPGYYLWTPGGYLYFAGYWDYPFANRGVLFAPVWFANPYQVFWGYTYTPWLTLDTGGLWWNFFAWPAYGHYCYGNYYAALWAHHGVYPWYVFHHHHHHHLHAYSTLYAHQLAHHVHHQDLGWAQGLQQHHQLLNGRADLRPPTTYAHHLKLAQDSHAAPQLKASLVARPLAHLTSGTAAGGSPRLVPVDAAQKKSITAMTQDLHRAQGQRAAQEAILGKQGPVTPPGAGSQGLVKPRVVDAPRTPIVSPPAPTGTTRPPVVTPPPAVRPPTGTLPPSGGKPPVVTPPSGRPPTVTPPRSGSNPPVVTPPVGRPPVYTPPSGGRPPVFTPPVVRPPMPVHPPSGGVPPRRH